MTTQGRARPLLLLGAVRQVLSCIELHHELGVVIAYVRGAIRFRSGVGGAFVGVHVFGVPSLRPRKYAYFVRCTSDRVGLNLPEYRVALDRHACLRSRTGPSSKR